VTRRVVVTGLGLVTPLGVEVDAVQAALLAGRSGLAAPRGPAAERAPIGAVGQVPEADVRRLLAEDPESAANGDPRLLYAAAAARRALADAGLDPARARDGGVALATGPGVHRIEDWDLLLDDEGRLDPERLAVARTRLAASSRFRHGAGEHAAIVARRHGLAGPVFAPVTACAAGAQAIGLALRAIRAGEAEWMLAGGADARLSSLGLVWFVLLGAAASREGAPAEACRPFDRRRTGVVPSEGAGVVVLESEEHARARGARARAVLAGYGSSLDAYRATAPCPDGRGAADALTACLEDAGLAPADVDLVSAHGTGTKRNDPAEVAAIKRVFGAHAARLAVPGLKSMLGHLLAASAPAAFASSVLSLETDLVPPTATLREPDAACDLDHVPLTAQRRPVRAALVNAFAFGGNNAVLALTRADTPRTERR
jgi:3-oxoacyl-[acyl-carrier-protein] synthase II